ncbi:MAG: 6-phosphofructokinase [Prevotellaceae bacterium]|jgi:6-phosphofructokinase 1|nr:6-phosphofructokinase [Prevotellaceae bacterium]
MINRKIGVLTSGGDAPGMNAAIRAVTRAGINNGFEVFGIRQGYKGLMEGDIFKLRSEDVSGIIQTGGTFLQTARSNEFRTIEGRKLAHEQLQKYNIDSLVVIGGDGSFTGANLFSVETNINVIGIPGTIDNDLYGTDYTIGYDTALNTVVQAVDKIRDTANSHNRVFFVEVMGREAGFIAINSCIACGAEVAVIPEEQGQLDKVRDCLSTRDYKKKSTIILVAEGTEEGNAMELSEKIKVEFPKLEIRISILGHMQRGGTPSAKDRIVASFMGIAAVEALLDNQKSIMIGWQNEQPVHVPLNKVIKMHKGIPHDYLLRAESISTFIPAETKNILK